MLHSVYNVKKVQDADPDVTALARKKYKVCKNCIKIAQYVEFAILGYLVLFSCCVTSESVICIFFSL